MFWEKKLGHWLDHRRAHSALPVRLQLWNGRQIDLGHPAPLVTVKVPHASSLAYLLHPTLDNLGRAYVEGKLEVEGRLNAVIEVANAMAERALPASGKLGLVARPLSHSRKVDAAAVEYHYDVSNEFYRAFLDPNMVYSCAYFENGDEDLETAQLKKIDHVLAKIRVQPGDTLLDIGCGWGALVLRAARQFGARCVGITLSKNQHALATRRVAEAGLSDRVEIRLQDYRDVEGTFDRVTSVGMFEHVGLKNLPPYFGRLRALLKDGGLAMNHGITTTSVDSRSARFGAGATVTRRFRF